MNTVVSASGRRTVRLMTVVVVVLLLIMLVAIIRRLVIDVPHVLAGTIPPETTTCGSWCTTGSRTCISVQPPLFMPQTAAQLTASILINCSGPLRTSRLNDDQTAARSDTPTSPNRL